VAIPGRFERREGEIRDGAHNPDGVRYLVERLRGSEPQGSSDARFRDVQRVQPEAETARGSEPQGRTGRRWTGADFTIVASILEDKDADTMLRELRRAGSRLVATRSSSTRSLPAATLAERARRYFDHVEEIDDPVEALARGHELGEPVLVTGSLYLLGDLAEAERRTTWPG
jgi:folylpolyglutamate synthase/dihydropteroate synthase